MDAGPPERERQSPFTVLFELRPGIAMQRQGDDWGNAMITNRKAAMAAFLLASVLWPACAGAQPRPQSIAVGATVRGNLSESDPELGDRRYDSYRIRLGKDEAIQVDMKSEALDSYLDVIAAGEDEPLKSHDDVG